MIDAKTYKGKVRTETRGGLLRPRTVHLRIGGRDQTRLIDGMRHQLELVSASLERADESVEVRGALCMANADGLPLFGHLEVDGIAIDGHKHVAKLAARPGSLARQDVNRIAAAIAQAFRPA